MTNIQNTTERTHKVQIPSTVSVVVVEGKATAPSVPMQNQSATVLVEDHRNPSVLV